MEKLAELLEKKRRLKERIAEREATDKSAVKHLNEAIGRARGRVVAAERLLEGTRWMLFLEYARDKVFLRLVDDEGTVYARFRERLALDGSFFSDSAQCDGFCVNFGGDGASLLGPPEPEALARLASLHGFEVVMDELTEVAASMRERLERIGAWRGFFGDGS